MTDRPKTIRTPDAQGWISIALVAAGGLLGSWISYERGAATTTADLVALVARVEAIEKIGVSSRIATITERVEHKSDKDHTHSRRR